MDHTTATELGQKPNSQEYYSCTKKATGSTSDESRLHGFQSSKEEEGKESKDIIWRKLLRDISW